MNTNKQYGAIDRFRVIAAFLIVGIHTYPLKSVSETLNYGFVNIFSRIAVPFFLMVTGYFVLPKAFPGKNGGSEAVFPAKFIKKTGLIYLLATALYLPLAIYAGQYSEGTAGDIFITVLRNIFLDGTFYHLWYLPASIIGVVIIYMLARRLSPIMVFGVAAGLYTIGIFGDSYYGALANVPVLNAVYDIALIVFSYTRNGIFYASVFLALGAVIAKSERKISKPLLTAGLTVSLCLLMCEGFLLRGLGYPRHDSMYLMLIPCSYFLFNLLISAQGKPAPALRDISMWIYILHPLFIALLIPAARVTGLTGILIDNSVVNYFAICLITLAAAIIIETLRRRQAQRT